MTWLPVDETSRRNIAHNFRSFPTTSGCHDAISGRYTTVLWRYDVISGVSLLSPTTSGHRDVISGRYTTVSWRYHVISSVSLLSPITSGHFRPLPVVMTSFPVDIRPFYGDMTIFPAFPYCRPPLPVISGHFRSSWRHFRPMYDCFMAVLPVAMTSLPVETTSCGVAGAKRERA